MTTYKTQFSNVHVSCLSLTFLVLCDNNNNFVKNIRYKCNFNLVRVLKTYFHNSNLKLPAAMDDLGDSDKGESLKKAAKIPFKFMDMHHEVINLVIEPSIDEDKILPKTGNTVISFNAHLDEIVPEDMQLRLLLKPPSTKKYLFDDFGIEGWLKELADNGHLKHVIWIKPPWAKGVPDEHRVLQINNAQNESTTEVSLDIKTLGRSIFEENAQEDYEGFQTMFNKYLQPGDPYILDFELSFFSSDNSFTEDYENCPNYYQLLQDIFKFKLPASMSEEDIKEAKEERVKNLTELEELFDYLFTHRTLPPVEGEMSENHSKVALLKEELLKHYTDHKIKWQHMYPTGLVCHDCQMPVHYTERNDIERMVNECVSKIVDALPSPPTVITVAVMYEYLRFSPEKDLDFIIDLLKDLFKKKYSNLDDVEFIGY